MKNLWNWIIGLFNHNKSNEAHEAEQEKRREEFREEAARFAPIKAAYMACEQNILVISGISCSNYIFGEFEINDLKLRGCDMVYKIGEWAFDGKNIAPRQEFLSFMYANGWEIINFNENRSRKDERTYSMIFKKR